MDITTIVGMVVCLGMVVLGIVTGDEGPAAMGHFYYYRWFRMLYDDAGKELSSIFIFI